MGFRERFERVLGVGRDDNPRRMQVARARERVDRAVVSTPGARLRISRDRHAGPLQKLVLWCARRGVPMELVAGPAGVTLDGRPVSAEEARARLADAR